MEDVRGDLWNDVKVLIVDDSSTSRALLCQLLKTLSVEIEAVGNASEFLRIIEKKDFDLILLDYRLPDSDGLKVLHQAREWGLNATIVMITGHAEMYTATQALSEGADGYVEKRHLKQGKKAFRATLESAMLNRRSVLVQQELQNLRHEIYGLVAHDLRSPAACASMALKMYQKDPSAEAIDTAIEALDRLFRRLENYHDLLRMDSPGLQMRLEDNCLYQLLDAVADGLEPVANASQQVMKWERPRGNAFLSFDWDWLYRAVENLVENAIKYGQPKGRITITCTDFDNRYEVKVADQAPVISESLRERIFKRYARGPETAKATRGMGLGLVIVKEVASRHNGTIELLPASNSVGNAFVLSLPKIGYESGMSPGLPAS